MKHFILISLLLGLSLTACGSSSAATPTAAPAQPTLASSPTVAPSPKPKTETDNTSNPSDARQIIGDAVNKWNTSGPYKMTVNSTLGGSQPMFMFIVPPDKSRYTQKQSDGSVLEGINIGKISYSFTDGAWHTSDSGGVRFDEPTWTDPAALNDIENIQALGTKPINGVNAQGFTFTDKSSPGETSTLWIGSNGAPVQVISVTTDETVTMDIVYDPSITVEAPVK